MIAGQSPIMVFTDTQEYSTVVITATITISGSYDGQSQHMMNKAGVWHKLPTGELKINKKDTALDQNWGILFIDCSLLRLQAAFLQSLVDRISFFF